MNQRAKSLICYLLEAESLVPERGTPKQAAPKQAAPEREAPKQEAQPEGGAEAQGEHPDVKRARSQATKACTYLLSILAKETGSAFHPSGYRTYIDQGLRFMDKKLLGTEPASSGKPRRWPWSRKAKQSESRAKQIINLLEADDDVEGAFDRALEACVQYLRVKAAWKKIKGRATEEKALTDLAIEGINSMSEAYKKDVAERGEQEARPKPKRGRKPKAAAIPDPEAELEKEEKSTAPAKWAEPKRDKEREFYYRGTNSKGEPLEGRLMAASQNDALSQLKEKGIFPDRVGEMETALPPQTQAATVAAARVPDPEPELKKEEPQRVEAPRQPQQGEPVSKETKKSTVRLPSPPKPSVMPTVQLPSPPQQGEPVSKQTKKSTVRIALPPKPKPEPEPEQSSVSRAVDRAQFALDRSGATAEVVNYPSSAGYEIEQGISVTTKNGKPVIEIDNTAPDDEHAVVNGLFRATDFIRRQAHRQERRAGRSKLSNWARDLLGMDDEDPKSEAERTLIKDRARRIAKIRATRRPS